MFRSFFLGGFECATGINRHGAWFDQIEATQHDRQVEEDYLRLTALDIHAAREGIRWPLVERGTAYDFSTVTPFLIAARRARLEIIWDLFHYGFPADCDPLASCFPGRFAAYCAAVARHVCAHSDGPWYFTPMNEPSYFSWAAGEVGRFAPHLRGCGRELKIALVRAAIQGIDAIRSVCPQARMVNVDPICRAVPPLGHDEMTAGAWHFNHLAVYEAWDMLSGRLMPELGGSRRHLDIVGINYYWNNQWEIGREEVALADLDPRRMALRDLVAEVWDRYGGEVLISETGHVGSGRAAWVDCITEEVVALQERGVPLAGVCWYPVLGMPEWHDRAQWAYMGLWDPRRRGDLLVREPCIPMIAALRRAQERLAWPTSGSVTRSHS
jgi:hypothetical protein